MLSLCGFDCPLIGRMADSPQNTASGPANAKVTAGLPRMNSKRALCKEGPVCLPVGDIWLLSAQHLSSTIFGLRNPHLLNPQEKSREEEVRKYLHFIDFPFSPVGLCPGVRSGFKVSLKSF